MRSGKDIIKERRETHGNPLENAEAIAAVWSGILGHEITSEQAMLMMAGLHIVREVRGTFDDIEQLVHAEGYVQIAKELKVRT